MVHRVANEIDNFADNLSYTEPDIRLIRQDDIPDFNVQLISLRHELHEAGPTLGPFASRSAALAAEVDWLDRHWLS